MAICSHCHTVTYPGGFENHKKGYCVDCAYQVKRKGEDDIPGLATATGNLWKGTHVYLIEFLKTL